MMEKVSARSRQHSSAFCETEESDSNASADEILLNHQWGIGSAAKASN
jgi:hypothetical protein